MARSKKAAFKHKRQHDNDVDSEDQKAAKRQQPTQPDRPLENEHDSAIAAMDPQLLSDHVSKTIKRHFKEKTALELEDQNLPSKAFMNTTTFAPPHTLKSLPEYLEDFAGGKANLKKSVEIATPHTLIVCASAIRAVDVARAVRVFRSDEAAIAKLFGKHLKLKDSIEYVKKNKIGLGVGTPARINDLLEAEALKSDGLERIVIDLSYVDEKKRTLFDMTELFIPVLNLLNRPEIKKRYGEDGIQILVF